MSKILVTGATGFVGMHWVSKLIKNPVNEVIGVDNFNDYYDPQLKLCRLRNIINNDSLDWKNSEKVIFNNFSFFKLDLTNLETLYNLFNKYHFDYVFHFAAQAGVGYSFTNPRAYYDANISAFFNILECCRHIPVKRLYYASSSSVYGNSSDAPFSELSCVEKPISFYAASKKVNELFAYSYAHNYNLSTVGLRFFTVYGPWGRPDMAYYKFTQSILAGKPIVLYNNGKVYRDFTYIDDVIEGINALFALDISGDLDVTNYEIFNIGNNNPIQIAVFVSLLETLIGKNAVKEYQPLPVGDVLITFADITKINSFVPFAPSWDIKKGLKKFLDWFSQHSKYKIEVS